LNSVSYGQEKIILSNEYPTKKELVKIDNSNYEITISSIDGNVLQKGHYYQEKNRLIPHGVWKIYDVNTRKLVTKSEYVMGVQQWIETTIDGEKVRYTGKDIEIYRLQKRITELEKLVKS
jgi:hypothetical protein